MLLGLFMGAGSHGVHGRGMAEGYFGICLNGNQESMEQTQTLLARPLIQPRPGITLFAEPWNSGDQSLTAALVSSACLGFRCVPLNTSEKGPPFEEAFKQTEVLYRNPAAIVRLALLSELTAPGFEAWAMPLQMNVQD